ncbi:MAG: class I SAM-dependent RNA methyltransferase [Pseudomonadota bacterium]
MTRRVLRLGHLGDGITDDGLLARRVLPGEGIDGVAENGRILKPKIIDPVEDRVKAPCRHYNSCGGCSLLHASDSFVSAWKASQVEAALGARGIEVKARRIATSPGRSRRRASFTGRRGKSGALLGFHATASAIVTEVPDCLVLDPAMTAVADALKPMVARLASRKGDLRVAVTLTENGPDVSISGAKPVDAKAGEALAAEAAAVGLSRLIVDGELMATLEAPIISFDGISVHLPAGAFLQATPHGEAALRQSVIEALGDAGRVLDLFSGCGTFALPLARRSAVHAVEGEPEMTKALIEGASRAKGLKPVTGETRDLFRRPLLGDEMKAFNALVMDPPRAGAEAQTAEIAKAGPPVVAMVSCNPVTFARDVATLVSGGYALNWVDVVDQFRWSPHIEIAASLSRDPSSVPVHRELTFST